MPECTTNDGVRISYDDVGSGAPIVFVHGNTDDRKLWAPIVEQLRDEARCVTLDLRGHGASGDSADYSALAMAQDVAAVVADAVLEEWPGEGHYLHLAEPDRFVARLRSFLS